MLSYHRDNNKQNRQLTQKRKQSVKKKETA